MNKKMILLLLIESIFLTNIFYYAGTLNTCLSDNYQEKIISLNCEQTMPKVAIEWAIVDQTNGENGYNLTRFVTALNKWGFTDIVKLNSTAGYGTQLNDVDILVIPRLSNNLTDTNMKIISNWWATGNKKIWVCGDADYYSVGVGIYGDLNVQRYNRILYNLSLSTAAPNKLFFEQDSIDSPTYCYGSGSNAYRVASYSYGNTTETAKITKNLPYNRTYFHGPCSIIGWNGIAYVDLKNSSLADVEVVAWTKNDTKLYNLAPVNGPYHVHTNASGQTMYGQFPLIALQTFSNGNKLILSVETIFGEYKKMFYGAAYEIGNSNPFLVYNAFMWFAGSTAVVDAAKPTFTNFTTTYNEISGELNITWDVSDVGSGVCGLEFYINGSLYKVISNNILLPTTTMVYTISNMSVNATTFKMKAIDFAGNIGSYPMDIQVPNAPKLLTVVYDVNHVVINWQIPDNNGGANISEYRIYRAKNSTGSYTKIGTTIGTSYSDIGLEIGIKYYYVVTAVNIAGESVFSNALSIIINNSQSSSTVNTSDTTFSPGFEFITLISYLTVFCTRRIYHRIHQ